MKNRVSLISIAKKIEIYSSKNGGVFGYADIWNLSGLGPPLAVARLVRKLTQNKVLSKIQRGIYVSKGFSLVQLAANIAPQGYISIEYVLSSNGLIGTVPSGIVRVITYGRGRTIKTPIGDIVLHNSNSNLIFGYTRNTNGIQVADSEKAFIDTLYYYTKGYRYTFDPLKEIACNKLNYKKVLKYLKKYHNPKFVKFVKGVLNEKP